MTDLEHELVPLPVHIAGVSAGVALGHAPALEHRRVRTRFANETVNDTNPVRPLLPEDPDRIIAYVETTGGDVYLCGSEQDAKRATPTGSVLPTAFTAAWPIHGQGAVWIVQKTGATTCVVSVTADYAITS